MKTLLRLKFSHDTLETAATLRVAAFLSALVEYLCAEVVELAGNVCWKRGITPSVMVPHDLELIILQDQELVRTSQ